jgi:L-ascorbate metabolism protein UlaG (beta-lactamase superfamily)
MSITIEWLGHACFRIRGSDGKSILIDPYDDSIGYRIPDYSCDILLISHEHFDHAAEHFVPSEHVTIREAGKHDAKGVVFEAKEYSHDEAGGRMRGHTLAFRFQVDGVPFAHLGDLGDIPSQAELDFLRGVNCLMIPVGGYFTINASQATQVVNELKPAYIFPMHYKTRVLTLPIGNVDDFLKDKSDVLRIADTKFTLEPDKLPSRPTIVVLDFM